MPIFNLLSCVILICVCTVYYCMGDLLSCADTLTTLYEKAVFTRIYPMFEERKSISFGLVK